MERSTSKVRRSATADCLVHGVETSRWRWTRSIDRRSRRGCWDFRSRDTSPQAARPSESTCLEEPGRANEELATRHRRVAKDCSKRSNPAAGRMFVRAQTSPQDLIEPAASRARNRQKRPDRVTAKASSSRGPRQSLENNRTSSREPSGVLNSMTNAGTPLAVIRFMSEGVVKRLRGSDVFHPPPATIRW